MINPGSILPIGRRRRQGRALAVVIRWNGSVAAVQFRAPIAEATVPQRRISFSLGFRVGKALLLESPEVTRTDVIPSWAAPEEMLLGLLLP